MPETLFMDRLLQILVGGGNDADIETAVRLVANGTGPTFLYGTQKHLLGFRCEVAHLVQEQRAAFGFMEITFLGTVRTRECPSDVSEESRRRKFFGERSAVHSYKRLSCPLALVVQQVGDMLLARAVLPGVLLFVSSPRKEYSFCKNIIPTYW